MGYTHGKRWTDDDIKREVRMAMDFMQINRMPSRSELLSVSGDNSLVSKIGKRPGGWYGLAHELGLQVKSSDTQTGKTNESVVEKLLIEKGFSVTKMSQNFPYDLLVDECVKIDVKSSKLYRGTQGNFYSFNLEKRYATCDVYVLLTLDDDGFANKFYIVPSVFVISNTQISIGEISSKYNKYIDRWDYITNLSEYFTKLKKEATHETKD